MGKSSDKTGITRRTVDTVTDIEGTWHKGRYSIDCNKELANILGADYQYSSYDSLPEWLRERISKSDKEIIYTREIPGSSKQTVQHFIVEINEMQYAVCVVYTESLNLTSEEWLSVFRKNPETNEKFRQKYKGYLTGRKYGL